MNNLQSIILYNQLYTIYKSLLTHIQCEIFEAYYVYNLSLREIAEEKNISHSAVECSLKQTISKLDDLENKMKLLAKQNLLLKKLETIKKSKELIEIYEQISALEEEINNGI